MKEDSIKFSEWCFTNNYTYLPKSKEWRVYSGTHGMIGFLYYTSDEVYQKYLSHVGIQGKNDE